MSKIPRQAKDLPGYETGYKHALSADEYAIYKRAYTTALKSFERMIYRCPCCNERLLMLPDNPYEVAPHTGHFLESYESVMAARREEERRLQEQEDKK